MINKEVTGGITDLLDIIIWELIQSTKFMNNIEQKKNFFREFAHNHLDALTIGSVFAGMIIAGLGSLETMQYYCFGIVWGTFKVFNNSTDFTTEHLVYRESLTAVEIGAFFLSLGISLLCLIWTLKIKGRDVRWIVIALIPFGWFIFLFIPDDRRLLRWGFHWRGRRQLLYLLTIVVLVSLFVISINYDLPKTDGEWMRAPNKERVLYDWDFVWRWIPMKDFSGAPLIIQLGGKYYNWLFITGGFLLSGILRKEFSPAQPGEPFV